MPGILDEVRDEDLLVFCSSVVHAGIRSLTAAGVSATNEQLLRAERDAETVEEAEMLIAYMDKNLYIRE